jgi:hypothetical protein
MHAHCRALCLKYKVTVKVRSMAARKREGWRKAVEAMTQKWVKAPFEEEKWLK